MYCDIRLRIINGSELGIGPGLIELLEETENLGSVTAAAGKMQMSTSKAWRIIKTTESHCNKKLLQSKSGGIGGGSTVLTDYAKVLVKAFREIEEACYKAGNEKLEKLESQIDI